jgi:RNA polymerase sigma-70 factor, ECF subfamily
LQCAEGQSDAWQRLAVLYGPLIFRWAKRTGCQAADAADIVQETLVAVAKAIHRFDPKQPHATFRGWLWTIARNKLHDLRRRQGESPAAIGGSTANAQLHQLVAGDPAPAISDPAPAISDDPPTAVVDDQATVLRQALAIVRSRVEPVTWQAFWRTAVEGADPNDVAKELGIQRWSVYKARARILQRIRSDLEGLIPPPERISTSDPSPASPGRGDGFSES